LELFNKYSPTKFVSELQPFVPKDRAGITSGQEKAGVCNLHTSLCQ